jgi:hypothetical protein
MHWIQEMSLWVMGVFFAFPIVFGLIPSMVRDSRKSKALKKCRLWSNEKLDARASYLLEHDQYGPEYEAISVIVKDRKDRSYRIYVNNRWNEMKDKA